MAILYPYFSEGVKPGDKGQLRAKEILWLNVGTGVVTALSDYEVEIDSHVDLKFYKGDLNIHLNLLDQTSDTASGPARVQLNAHVDENGTYEVAHDKLVLHAVLGGKQQKLTLSRDKQNMTKCELNGSMNLTAYVAPM